MMTWFHEVPVFHNVLNRRKKDKSEIKSEIVNDFKIFVFCLSFQNLSSVSFFRKPTGGAYQTSPTLFQLASFMMTSHLLTSSECHTWNWFSRLMCSTGSGWNLEFVLFMFLMFNYWVCYCHVSVCDLHQLQVYPGTTCITLIQRKLSHVDQKYNVICKTSYFIANKDSNFRTEKCHFCHWEVASVNLSGVNNHITVDIVLLWLCRKKNFENVEWRQTGVCNIERAIGWMCNIESNSRLMDV